MSESAAAPVVSGPDDPNAPVHEQSGDTPVFDPQRAWTLAPQVSLRPEPFGALAYHFGTRRLSFLTSRRLLSVVESLQDQPSARHACRSAGVTEEELGTYERALATLAERGMIERVEQ